MRPAVKSVQLLQVKSLAKNSQALDSKTETSEKIFKSEYFYCNLFFKYNYWGH